MMTGEVAFLGFSSSDLLVDGARVSAMPICLITSQRTFVLLNFKALTNFLKFSLNFTM